MYKFKGKSKEELLDDSCQMEVIMAKGEWVEGSLIWNNGNPYIVGNVVESCEEYISLEFWCPVERESIKMIEPNLERLQKDSVELSWTRNPDRMGK